jgi:hypothetical protein
MDWHRINDEHYYAQSHRGTYFAHRIDGVWTLWFQARHTRGAIRQSGCWNTMAETQRQAETLDSRIPVLLG